MSFRKLLVECVVALVTIAVIGVYSPQDARAESSADNDMPTTVGFSVVLGISSSDKDNRATTLVPLPGHGQMECTGDYDHPHPSSYTKGTTVNAHPSVDCVGSLDDSVKIKVSSSMHTTSGRVGKTSTREGYKRVKGYGDLACTRELETYYAVADVEIWYPAPYARPYDSFRYRSKFGKFKKDNKGKCMRIGKVF